MSYIRNVILVSAPATKVVTRTEILKTQYSEQYIQKGKKERGGKWITTTGKRVTISWVTEYTRPAVTRAAGCERQGPRGVVPCVGEGGAAGVGGPAKASPC